MTLSTNMKKLIAVVHCVVTMLLVAPLFLGLYSTALFGTSYTEPQAISAFILLSVAIMLNFLVLRVFEGDIRKFLGDDK